MKQTVARFHFCISEKCYFNKIENYIYRVSLLLLILIMVIMVVILSGFGLKHLSVTQYLWMLYSVKLNDLDLLCFHRAG